MNVDDLVRTVLRRKWATLAVIVLAVLAGYVGFTSAQTTFESRAALLIYPPGAGDPDAGLNPFTRLDNGIAQLGVVATTIMQGDVAAEAFAATGATSYTVDNVAGDTSSVAQLTPRLAITVTASNAESAQAGAQTLIDVVSRELEAVQRTAGQRNGTLAQTTVLNPPLPGVAAGSNAPRAAGAYAAAVLIPGLLLILGVSSYFDRRRTAKEVKPVKTQRAAAPVSRKDRRKAAKLAAEPESRVVAKARTEPSPPPEPLAPTPAETRTVLHSEPDELESADPEPTARAWSAVDSDQQYPAGNPYDDDQDTDQDRRSWDDVRSKLAADQSKAVSEPAAPRDPADDPDHDYVASAFGATRADPFFSADVATERLEIGAIDRRLDRGLRDDEPVGWDIDDRDHDETRRDDPSIEDTHDADSVVVGELEDHVPDPQLGSTPIADELEIVDVPDSDVVDDVPEDIPEDAAVDDEISSAAADVESDEADSATEDSEPADPEPADPEPADPEPADPEPADSEGEAADAADLEVSDPKTESDAEASDVADEADETEVSEPEVSEPEVSEPEVSEPEVSEPESKSDEADEADEAEDNDASGDWERDDTLPKDRTPDDRAGADREPKQDAPRGRKPAPRKAAAHVDDYYGVDEEFDHGTSRDANSVR